MINPSSFLRTVSWLPEKQHFSYCLLLTDKIMIREALDPEPGRAAVRPERGTRMKEQIGKIPYRNHPPPRIYLRPLKDLPRGIVSLLLFCAKFVQNKAYALGSQISRLVLCGASAISAMLSSADTGNIAFSTGVAPGSSACASRADHTSGRERQPAPLEQYQHYLQRFKIAERQIDCRSRYVEPRIPGVIDSCYRPGGWMRIAGPIAGAESRHSAFASVLTAWQIPSDVDVRYYRNASDLLDGPISAQLLNQLAYSARSLVFPDSVYQVTRAIEHGWNLAWYDAYRAALPKDKSQETCYLHAIAAVVTKKDILVATQGDCMAHLVTGSQIRRLVGFALGLGGLTQGRLNEAYKATPARDNLPMQLSPALHAKPAKPKIISIPRKQWDGSLLVLTTPGTYDALSSVFGPHLNQAWFESLMTSPGTPVGYGFARSSETAGPRSGGITVLDFSNNIGEEI
jgi:hypothetical protein